MSPVVTVVYNIRVIIGRWRRQSAGAGATPSQVRQHCIVSARNRKYIWKRSKVTLSMQWSQISEMAKLNF